MNLNNNTSPQVINTRPAPMGLELEALLQKHKFSSLYQPALENRHFPNATATLNIEDIVSAILVFVSRPAVDAFYQQIKHKPDIIAALKQHQKIVAVGQGTANQLAEHLLISPKSILTPERTDSEGVLGLSVFSEELNKNNRLKPPYTSQKVHIFKGTGGRELIKNALNNRGFEVCEWSLYERVAIHYPKAIDQWIDAKFIIVTSKDVLKSVIESLQFQQKIDLNQWSWVAFSDRIREALLNLGIEKSNIYICEHMNNSSIIHKIESIG